MWLFILKMAKNQCVQLQMIRWINYKLYFCKKKYCEWEYQSEMVGAFIMLIFWNDWWNIMGIISGIFKSRDAPKNRTAGSAYSFFIGQSAAGKRVNERSAMQTSAVYACVRVISESVASLPLHVYRYNKNGGKEKALDHPLYHLLHDEPNLEMTAYSFFEVALTHLLLWVSFDQFLPFSSTWKSTPSQHYRTDDFLRKMTEQYWVRQDAF